MGSMFLYDPKRYPKEHQRYDIDFKKYCCEAAGLCDEYRKRRPSSDCTGYIPPISCKLQGCVMSTGNDDLPVIAQATYLQYHVSCRAV